MMRIGETSTYINLDWVVFVEKGKLWLDTLDRLNCTFDTPLINETFLATATHLVPGDLVVVMCLKTELDVNYRYFYKEDAQRLLNSLSNHILRG